MGIETISLIVTILLALGGYLVTYQQKLRLTRRKERLDLINKRLDEFYFPCYYSGIGARQNTDETLTEIKRESNTPLVYSTHYDIAIGS